MLPEKKSARLRMALNACHCIQVMYRSMETSNVNFDARFFIYNSDIWWLHNWTMRKCSACLLLSLVAVQTWWSCKFYGHVMYILMYFCVNLHFEGRSSSVVGLRCMQQSLQLAWQSAEGGPAALSQVKKVKQPVLLYLFDTVHVYMSSLATQSVRSGLLVPAGADAIEQWRRDVIHTTKYHVID